jgi:hypothetical protein
MAETDYRRYAIRQLEEALAKEADDCHGSAMLHEEAALVALEEERIPLPGEVLQKLSEVERLEKWVDDLQRGMYINCVYCGFRYGPNDVTPATMADALKEHIEMCPKHPLSALKWEAAELRIALEAAKRTVNELKTRCQELATRQ